MLFLDGNKRVVAGAQQICSSVTFVRRLKVVSKQLHFIMALDVGNSLPMPTAYILTALSILCSIVTITILVHLLANVFGCCSNERLTPQRNTAQNRWLLIFSIASIISLCGQSLIQISQFTNSLANATVHCQIYYGLHLGAYAISKHSMHAFFVRRMAQTFHNTTLAIARRKLFIFCLISFGLMFVSSSFIVMICMDVIAEDNTFGGTYCTLKSSRSTYLELYIAMIFITDVIPCFLINFTMVHKLLALVTMKLQANVSTALREAISS